MTDRSPTRAARFRSLLMSPGVAFVMEAHDGMSARIAQEAGFEAIWASGLSISASMGVRDANEASWTQVLEHVEFMADATTAPIMVDADTGYGNFNNVRRLVRKLEERGIAAMCIEDKLYPKANSYIRGEEQPLVDVAEFCGKLRAAKDTQRDPDFTVVARCEALITGLGMGEALYRAEAYREAGADAVLVHSKQATADEILEFMAAWSGACPIDDRADHLPPHRARGLRTRGDRGRDLGQPAAPRQRRRDAADGGRARADPVPRGHRGADRHGPGDLPPHRRIRAGRGRPPILPAATRSRL